MGKKKHKKGQKAPRIEYIPAPTPDPSQLQLAGDNLARWIRGQNLDALNLSPGEENAVRSALAWWDTASNHP